MKTDKNAFQAYKPVQHTSDLRLLRPRLTALGATPITLSRGTCALMCTVGIYAIQGSNTP